MAHCTRCKGRGVEPGPDEQPHCEICNSVLACPNPKYHGRAPLTGKPEKPEDKEKLEDEVLSKLNYLTKYVRYAFLDKEGPPNLVEFENVLVECEETIEKIEQFGQSRN